MTDDLVIDVSDLVGHLEARRSFGGQRHARLRLGDTTVDGKVSVSGEVVGTLDGVIASFQATAPARFQCVRCLTSWEDTLSVAGEQYFGRVIDEDGYGIEDRLVDVGKPAIDEVSLELPGAPICRPDCKGLCPNCGTDLNSEPCDGHGEDSDSPFAALRDLFDS